MEQNNIVCDISGWDYDSKSHGELKCWNGISQEVQEHAIKVMNEFRERFYGIRIEINVYPVHKELLDFVNKAHREQEMKKYIRDMRP